MHALLWISLCSKTAYAQVIPDGSLSTSVNSTDNIHFTIENGDNAGTNLFHSFDEFSIAAGGSVHFENAADIGIIFSRVTGSNHSSIDGTISANGSADLFLLNPNGIVFGSNAKLNIGGSFIGSTAEALIFEDGTIFGADPGETTLILTMSAPVGLQMGIASSAINTDVGSQLIVEPRKTLALVGRELSLQGTTLRANDGHIELGAVRGSQMVMLSYSQSNVVFDYIDATRYGPIDLDQATTVDVSGDNSGSIQTYGSKIRLLNGASFNGTVLESGAGESIRVSASESLQLSGIDATTGSSSMINSAIAPDATGTSSNITIKTPLLRMRDGAIIGFNGYGSGQLGELQVTAEQIELVGFHPFLPVPTGLFSWVRPGSFTNGGTINISTQRLNLIDGGQIYVLTEGLGKSGDITVEANAIRATNQPHDGIYPSGVSNTVFPRGQGHAGRLTINAQDIFLFDGSLVLNGTFGDGNGGDLLVNATNITAQGTRVKAIEALNIEGSESGFVSSAFTGSTGAGGNISVDAQTITLLDGAEINSSSGPVSEGGNILINADEITVRGEGDFGNSPALIGSGVDPGFQGDAGNLTINTQTLNLSETGSIFVDTRGQGNGGNLSINASERIDIDGGGLSTNSILFGSSTIGARVLESSVGDGGTVTITTPQLTLRNGGVISSANQGQGLAGSITIEAGLIEMIGTQPNSGLPSQISATSDNKFDAGDVFVTADQLRLQQGATIAVSNERNGPAGDLTINAARIELADSSSLRADVTAGNQGNININSQFLLLSNQSDITTNATGAANGGNITLISPLIVGRNNSDIVANAVKGKGGNINITTEGLLGLELRDQLTPDNDITASSQFGVSGTVAINNPEADDSSQVLELSNVLVDVTQLVRPGCSVDDDQFVLAGRGGLPTNPLGPLSGDRPWIDLRNLSEFVGHRVGNTMSDRAPDPTGATFDISPAPIEATAWQVNSSGQIELRAMNLATVTPSAYTHCATAF
ncbi:MAG: filamentous hemagglutinin N-terminal domain-containing protein [Cyanobacteria bacterium P01_F01_bin.150]